MPVRSTMLNMIARVRMLIADPEGTEQQFLNQDYQDHLDHMRDDVRYEGLKIAPSIVNAPSTGNTPQTIFANYYSHYQFWEEDVVLQGLGPTGAAWVVLTPVASDYIVGRWQFEINEFTTGTVPGQLPPVFATGKTYDIYATAALMLEMWAATFAGAYNISVDGQNLQRSQLMTAKLALAAYYRERSKPRTAKMDRHDVMAPISSKRMRLLDADDVVKGA